MYINICIYIYIYMCVYIHTYIYIYIYICSGLVTCGVVRSGAGRQIRVCDARGACIGCSACASS